VKTVKQETRPGTENLKEVDTVTLLETLTPPKRGRCRSGTKAVGSACVEAATTQKVNLDGRAGVALSRAAYYLRTLPQREAEVKKAAKEVLKAGRKK
jgi:hypothetical protein